MGFVDSLMHITVHHSCIRASSISPLFLFFALYLTAKIDNYLILKAKLFIFNIPTEASELTSRQHLSYHQSLVYVIALSINNSIHYTIMSVGLVFWHLKTVKSSITIALWKKLQTPKSLDFLFLSQGNMNFLASDKILCPGQKFFLQDNFLF